MYDESSTTGRTGRMKYRHVKSNSEPLASPRRRCMRMSNVRHMLGIKLPEHVIFDLATAPTSLSIAFKVNRPKYRKRSGSRLAELICDRLSVGT